MNGPPGPSDATARPSEAGLTLRAPAKVNLRLSVLAREASGYHQIETVFHALELADELSTVIGGTAMALRVHGADVGPAEDNLVIRAAKAFREAAGLPEGAQFTLHKHIPAGAGLGGGSSDAAATLRALNTLCDAPLSSAELATLGGAVGSDVPFFLCGSPHALAWGRGQRLLPLPPLPERPVLLIVPPFTSATGEAYRRLDETPPHAPSADPLHQPALLRWEDVARAARNDFEAMYLPDHPPLGDVRDALRAAGAAPALLAGSGSALFGVFPDEAALNNAAREIADAWPGLQFIPTRTAAE